MTIFGVDISNWNAGLDLAEVKREGFSFVIAKISEGNTFQDSTWPGFRDTARANGLTLAGYHYVRTDSPESQAQNCAAHIGDTTIPVMLDFESGSGDITNFWAVKHAMEEHGLHVALSYLPYWYWEQIGRPDLTQVPGLVMSDYVSGSGYASSLYPGDGPSNYWAGYGGNNSPAILQFTDAAQVAGRSIDANAYRGTVNELAALLNTAAPAPSPASPPNRFAGMTDTQKLEWAVEQLSGPDSNGWPQLGGHSMVDALAVLGKQLGVPGFGLVS